MKDYADKFENFFVNEIGLIPHSIAQSVWENILRKVSEEWDNMKPWDLYYKLSSDKRLFQDFVEKIVVSETWFFRDPTTMNDLCEVLKRKEDAKGDNERFISILSLGCSSGEEPYSLAIALLNHKFMPHEFFVDAVDLCDKSITEARSGMYYSRSFHEYNTLWQTKYFKNTEKGYQIDEKLKKNVNFYQGNVISKNFPSPQPFYNAIICKNLFIYLNQQARKTLIDFIGSHLVEGGLVLTTAVELGLFEKSGPFIQGRDGILSYNKSLLEVRGRGNK